MTVSLNENIYLCSSVTAYTYLSWYQPVFTYGISLQPAVYRILISSEFLMPVYWSSVIN